MPLRDFDGCLPFDLEESLLGGAPFLLPLEAGLGVEDLGTADFPSLPSLPFLPLSFPPLVLLDLSLAEALPKEVAPIGAGEPLPRPRPFEKALRVLPMGGCWSCPGGGLSAAAVYKAGCVPGLKAGLLCWSPSCMAVSRLAGDGSDSAMERSAALGQLVVRTTSGES